MVVQEWVCVCACEKKAGLHLVDSKRTAGRQNRPSTLSQSLFSALVDSWKILAIKMLIPADYLTSDGRLEECPDNLPQRQGTTDLFDRAILIKNHRIHSNLSIYIHTVYSFI